MSGIAKFGGTPGNPPFRRTKTVDAPDHRPHLREGDLRTPEDVLAWLKERWIASVTHDGRRWAEHHVLEETHDVLAERLDRERREACRRAVRSMARSASYAKRMQRLRLRDCSVHGVADARAWHEERVVCLRRALAFRAAARTP